MFIKSTIVLVIACVQFNAVAQLQLNFERDFTVRTKQFRVDPLGYTIWFDRESIYKMDTSGVLMFQQSLKSYGAITDIDVVSPMKYLLFFREQQSIGFFDNTFSPYQSRARLADLDVSYATLVCYSMQFDRFWVFDQDNSKLILFNSTGQRALETENLKGIIGLDEPVQMLERNGNLFLVDANRGVYIFDMFGALVNFIEIKGVQWIQVDANNLFYVSDAKLVGYNFKTKITFHSSLVASFNMLFQYVKDKMYFLSPELLKVYKVA